MLLPLALALALGAPTDTTLAAPPAQAAPAVLVHRQPALPVVALRMSVLADDPPGHAGAGHLFQHLHLRAMEEQVARVGGRVQAVRNADAVVYTVVGPATELAYLAGVLRGALRPPSPGTGEMLSALAALSEERAAERDIAQSYVRAALRARLFPGERPAAGTDGSAARLETARLAEVWGEMYAPDRVSVVAVGDVSLEAVRREFQELPSVPGGLVEAVEDSVPALQADTPQATRAWIASAWRADEDDEPALLSVTARLLQNRLRRRMTRSQVDVEHWWTHQGQAVALVVATPDTLAPLARRSVAAALTSLAGELTEDAVRDAAAGVRRDLLFYSRTPERMAEVLGSFADRAGDAEAAQRYFAALEAVTEEGVRGILEALRAREAVTLEVAPQKLVRN